MIQSLHYLVLKDLLITETYSINNQCYYTWYQLRVEYLDVLFQYYHADNVLLFHLHVIFKLLLSLATFQTNEYVTLHEYELWIHKIICITLSSSHLVEVVNYCTVRESTKQEIVIIARNISMGLHNNSFGTIRICWTKTIYIKHHHYRIRHCMVAQLAYCNREN